MCVRVVIARPPSPISGNHSVTPVHLHKTHEIVPVEVMAWPLQPCVTAACIILNQMVR